MTEIIKQTPRKVRADFHNHLITSSRIKDEHFNRAVDIAAKRLGNGGTFGMIDFADYRYARLIRSKGYEREPIGEKINAVYIPEKDVTIIHGQEVPAQFSYNEKDYCGHLLVLGLGWDESVKQYKSLEDTIKQARDFGATIILDHPFGHDGAGTYFRRVNFDLFKEIDGIETFNGEAGIFLFANWKARRILLDKISTYNVGDIATSDGHSFYELGRSWTEIDEPSRKPNEFLQSLRNSVKNTRDAKRMENKFFGFVGAADHVADLKLWMPLTTAVGAGYLFETQRPEGPQGYLPPGKVRKK